MLKFSANDSDYLPILVSLIGLPGGPLVQNPPAKTRDMGSIPVPGRSHIPRDN